MNAELRTVLAAALATRAATEVQAVLDGSLVAGLTGFGLTEAAVQCKEGGFPGQGETLLARAIERDPRCVAAYYELAVIQRLDGRHHEALESLRTARRLAPADRRVALLQAHLLYAIGAWEDATEVLHEAPARSSAEQHDAETLAQFGRYVRRVPLSRALYNLASLKAQRPYLNAADVADRIRAALAARRPFALIRMGDGEGSFTVVDRQDEAGHAALYSRNRNEFVRMWWGSSADRHALGFDQVGYGTAALAAECDVVGVPYESWLRHEYAIASPRGIPGLANIHRHFLANPANEPKAFCSQHVHLELHKAGLLEPLLRETRSIGLVSCRSDLPSLMQRRFGIGEVVFHPIPSERNFDRNPAKDDQPHFPDAFGRLQAELACPHEGRLFLVAGGILGKYYALTIRRHGGVALDIGSLADGWCGLNTRPGYNGEMAL